PEGEGASAGGPPRPADLPVAVEQRLATRVALHEQQRTLDDVDAARTVGVDPIAPRDGVADARHDVAQVPGLDVALERVELQVERQPDVDRLDAARRLAQQL